MYTKLVITITLITLSIQSQAITSDLKKDYDDFRKDYQTVLNLPENKKEFLKKFKKLEQDLNTKYEKFGQKEGELISPESNQMALDIEMLEPLKIIAEGEANKESCSNAAFTNELNNTSDNQTYQKIKKQINKLCK